jgi:small subunit ribosomal protein S3
MGQKVHPYGFRLGITKTWRSRWFAKQDYARLLHEDLQLKESLLERLKAAGVSSIEVDRPGNKLRITIRTSRPGIIIGRKGAEIEKLKGDLAKKTNREVFIDIQEVHRPELDAQLVSESIALQLEKRVAFRRAMRKAVDSALRFGCKGIKVRVSGRLNGAEIARSEWYLQGQLPLHTLRADIDYGFSQSYTTYGVIGVKVWIYKGEVLEGGNRSRNTLRADAEPRRRRNPRDDRGRDDRGDRGPDRGGDRGGDRRPPQGGGGYANVQQQPAPYSAPPVADVTGPVVQQAPADLPKPASAPVIAPMSAPVAPSWKQEQQKPADAVETPAVEQAPVDTATETPKESSE